MGGCEQFRNAGQNTAYDTLETCVKRAVMTGINQMAGQTSINNALEMGAEYVKVSKHSDARVNQRYMQTKINRIWINYVLMKRRKMI